MAAKTKEVCNTINNITNSPNSPSPDVALAVLSLSPQARLQYHQQTNRHDWLQITSQVVQRTLDTDVMKIFGFDPRSPDAYSKEPATLSGPSIMPDLIALPVRHKSLRLRRLDDFVGGSIHWWLGHGVSHPHRPYR